MNLMEYTKIKSKLLNVQFILDFQIFQILLLSFAIGSSLPAAVSEDSNEPNVSHPLTNISSPQEVSSFENSNLLRTNG